MRFTRRWWARLPNRPWATCSGFSTTTCLRRERRSFSASGQTPTVAAGVGVLGALCVPLVYFSIWFFRTQHPQPVMGGGGSIDPRMLHVLLINWLAFSCFAFLVCWSRYRLESLQREVEEAQALESLLGDGRPSSLAAPTRLPLDKTSSRIGPQ